MGKRIKTQKTLGKTVTIAGKKYDQEMIYAFRRATRSSKGNKGKNVLISVADAKQIFDATRPDLTGRSTYDKLEKSTMAYIRKTGNFTDAAKKELAKLIAKAAGKQAARTRAMKAMKAAKAKKSSVVVEPAAAMKAMKAAKAKKTATIVETVAAMKAMKAMKAAKA